MKARDERLVFYEVLSGKRKKNYNFNLKTSEIKIVDSFEHSFQLYYKIAVFSKEL